MLYVILENTFKPKQDDQAMSSLCQIFDLYWASYDLSCPQEKKRERK